MESLELQYLQAELTLDETHAFTPYHSSSPRIPCPKHPSHPPNNLSNSNRSTRSNLLWQPQNPPHSLLKCILRQPSLRTRIRASRQLETMRRSPFLILRSSKLRSHRTKKTSERYLLALSAHILLNPSESPQVPTF